MFVDQPATHFAMPSACEEWLRALPSFDSVARIIDAIGASSGRAGHVEDRKRVVGMPQSDRAGQQAQRDESVQDWF